MTCPLKHVSPFTDTPGAMRRGLLAMLISCLFVPVAAGAATPRIVGGALTTIDVHPYQVALLAAGDGPYGEADEYHRQFCGGVILDTTHVATAAHCVFDTVAPGEAAAPASIQVLAGTNVLAHPTAGVLPAATEQRIPVVATSFDPEYDPGTADHDAAVLTLAQPVTTGSAEPIPLLSDDSFAQPADAVTVSGWGDTVVQQPDGTVDDHHFPHHLRDVTTHVVSTSACDAAYGGDGDDHPISARMICAGELVAGGKDSCQGDSGGPLVANTGDHDELVGLVSTGSGCAWPGYPGIYTRAYEPAIATFLQSAHPPAPTVTTPGSLTGDATPGGTLTCAPGDWTDAPTFSFRFLRAAGATAESADPTYTVTAADAGTAIACMVAARNDGGYGRWTSEAVAIPTPAAPAAPIAPPPPPAVLKDTTRPRAFVKTGHCRKHHCAINVAIVDPPYSAGLVKPEVAVRSTETVRCSRAARRHGRRHCTQTRSRRARVARLGGNVFTITLPSARPGRHRFTITAVDAAGNRQAKPTRVTLRVKRGG
jgi:hypothetical protein